MSNAVIDVTPPSAAQQERARQHATFARQEVGRLPGFSTTSCSTIDRVTVVGGGLMGTGIAIAVLSADKKVTLVELQPDARARAEASIRAAIRRDVDKGRIAPAIADSRMALLRSAARLDDAAEAQLFIEAVFEDMAIKRQVFTRLDRVAPADAILASNTSTLDLNSLAACTKRPESVVGLHFFSPANIMRLLEIVRGAATSAATLSAAIVFAREIGKVGVVSGVCDGFIGNRIFAEYLRQAGFLLDEGALPGQVDGALEGWGMAMGPFRTMDLAGHDVGWKIRQRHMDERPERPYSRIPDRVYEMGRMGQKSGAGFYLYPDGRTPQPDPAIDALVIDESARLGIQRRAFTDEEIISRCVLAMVNEGARVVGERIAFRPLDIDVVYLDGYGFPVDRGGPMFYADEIGLPRVLDTLRAFEAGRHGGAWVPAPLLLDLVRRGVSFESLNRSSDSG
jgi:3-hydroxyacyl-CoA dehydrogenase